jgi:endonuclease G
MRVFIAFLVLSFVALSNAVAVPFDDCAEHLPFGVPRVNEAEHTTPVCHKGYAALHDDDLLVPRWVAYKLTGPHTFGCLSRSNKFHVDDLLEGKGATPADYKGSGYDQGHQAPAQDFAWNSDLSYDSFSMVNMAPQKPQLNRQGWKRLEEIVRVWAADRGTLIVYVGPVFLQKHKTIGKNKVAVPKEFWKVVVDPEKREALAFIMPQQKVAIGKLDPWETSVADVERAAGVQLPLPDNINRKEAPDLWPANLSAWKSKKRSTCSQKKQ